MASATALEYEPPPNLLRRWSLRDYHRLIETGILTENDRVELLEGWIVDKMPHNPPHDGTLFLLQTLLTKLVPVDWLVRVQSALTVRGRRGSEPEPDLAVVRGPAEQYLGRHPGPADTGLVVEVSDTTLEHDRGIKQRIYARAAIPYYWVVNIPGRRVEIYHAPQGGRNPLYQRRTDFTVGETLSLVLDNRSVGKISVSRIFPAG